MGHRPLNVPARTPWTPSGIYMPSILFMVLRMAPYIIIVAVACAIYLNLGTLPLG